MPLKGSLRTKGKRVYWVQTFVATHQDMAKAALALDEKLTHYLETYERKNQTSMFSISIERVVPHGEGMHWHPFDNTYTLYVRVIIEGVKKKKEIALDEEKDEMGEKEYALIG